MVVAEYSILAIFSVLLITVHCTYGPVKSGVNRKLEAEWRREEMQRMCQLGDPMCRRQAILETKLLRGNQAEIGDSNAITYQEPAPPQYWTTQSVQQIANQRPRQGKLDQQRAQEEQRQVSETIAREEWLMFEREEMERERLLQAQLEAQQREQEWIRLAAQRQDEERVLQAHLAAQRQEEMDILAERQRVELDERHRRALLQEEEQKRLDDEARLTMLSRDKELAEQAHAERMAELNQVIHRMPQDKLSATDVPDLVTADPFYHEDAQMAQMAQMARMARMTRKARMAELEQLKNNPLSMSDRRRIFGRAHLTPASAIPFEKLGKQMATTGLSLAELEERALIRSMINLYLDMIADECKDYEFSTKLSRLIPFMNFPETRKLAAELMASIFEVQDLHGNQNRLLNMLLSTELATTVFHPGRRLKLKRPPDVYDESLLTAICQLSREQIDVELAKSCI